MNKFILLFACVLITLAAATIIGALIELYGIRKDVKK